MATPGSSVTFSIVCVQGSSVGTSATLFGTTLGLSARIPMGPATHKGVFVTTVTIPASTMPGTYSPSVDCSNGPAGTGSVTVVAAVKPSPKPVVVVPSGAPVTGDGVTSTATGGPLTAAGLGLLGASGLVGVAAVRRRRAKASK
jgi:hypothetical protein